MEDVKLLSADEILNVNDITYEVVNVPEWKGKVRLRSLNGEEAVRFAEDFKDDKNAAARILLMSAVKEDGSQLFTADQLERLQKKSMKAVLRLQKVAMRINGLSDDEQKKTGKD